MKTWGGNPTLFFFLLFLCFPLLIFAQTAPIRITAPYGSLIDVGTEQFMIENPQGYLITPLVQMPAFPMMIRGHAPLGGIVDILIENWENLVNLDFPVKLIKDKNSHPETMAAFPKLCRNVTLNRWPNHESPMFYALIDMQQDRLNRQPVMQLLDPDSSQMELSKEASASFRNFDGKNVLTVQSMIISNDYEDSSIIDYEGPNPLTGKIETVHEGEGGFYANFHYTVLPYNSALFKMDRQTLLHFVQGKMKEIRNTAGSSITDNEEELSMPVALKTHGLLPGPFASREGAYPLCEWGDTAHQAPLQRVDYQDFGIWDWDYPVRKADHIILIVWEGDEEDWLISQNLIDPTYLTDDIVGLFDIKKRETQKPITLKNSTGDFSITVVTGNIEMKN